VFYKAARIGQRIKNYIRLSTELSTAERSDLLFYLIYAVVAKQLGKKDITFNDIKLFDIDALSDDNINIIKASVYQKYKELGGNGRVAKSSSFVNEVDSVIGL
jgi:hypothetical protein